MKKRISTTSRLDSIICPRCGIEELGYAEEGPALCEKCEFVWEDEILRTLKQIASLPDASGSHPCECGHPEMRYLPDGTFHCPACSSEVLSVSATSGEVSGSGAYWLGWSYGFFGERGSFAYNRELSQVEEPLKRLDYYRGCRAGEEARDG